MIARKMFGVLLVMLMVLLLIGGCAPAAPPPGVSAPTPSPRSEGAPTPSAKPKLEKIKLQLPAKSSVLLSFYLGKEAGIFQQERIDLELFIIKSVLTIPVLTAGEVDFTNVFSFSMYAGMKGAPVRAIMVVTKAPTTYLYGGRGVETPQDLKGKAIAVTGIGSLGHAATKEALRYLGLDPNKDVTFVGVGAEAERYLALKGGSVAAADLNPPYNLIAKEDGFKELIFAGDVVEMPFSGLATSLKKIKENPDQVKRMMRATLKSIAYVRDHPQESIQLLMKEFGLEEKIARVDYENRVKTTSLDGNASEKALQKMVEVGKDMGQVTGKEKLEDGVDFSLLREVQQELKLR